MLALLGLHLAAALCAPMLVRVLRRDAFFILALVPASAVVWALFHTSQAFTHPYTQSVPWVPRLGLFLAFRIDPLSWLMMIIVGGVGALVMVYAGRYFSAKAKSLGRFSGVFVAFAGAMLGIVTTDQTLALYFFWEMTSVLSFLLIGHHHSRGPARAAARQAFLVTGSGALAMFAGFVILGATPEGSFRISSLIAALQKGTLDPTSPAVIVAGVLILLGAFSKSAQVPFHFWLPGAMAAPTPVSAYLHAAAMVKAGIYLVARLTPAFALVPLWSVLTVVVGLFTMLVGSYRALRQYDLKLILAYGTVSQLGLMMAAVGMGNAAALSAGLVMLVAHSFFKSTLFLSVGAVEAATSTRDLRELSGLWRSKPLLASAAALATLSMAGIPVTTGYLGKEALISALTHHVASAWMGQNAPAITTVFLVILVAGSIMTFAYSWRFWWGAFATKRVQMQHQVKRTPRGMAGPIAFLSCGAFLGLAAHPLTVALTPAVEGLPGEVHLALWSGWIPALLTALIIAAGAVMAYFRPAVARIQRRLAPKGSVVGAYAWSMRELELLSTRVTGLLHRGSLPSDLAVIFGSFVTVSLYAIHRIANGTPTDLPSEVEPVTLAPLKPWDSPIQLVLVALILLAAFITVRARRRMKAALALSAVGTLVTLLFAFHGAPDLALTQLAVEAVSLVVFVLVLRRLPLYFSDRPLPSSRWWRMALAILVGLVVTLGGWYAVSARVADPISALMPAEALGFGDGQNVVNVILVDMRAWDTVGELSVLLVTATGVASLIYVQSRSGKISRAPEKSKKSAAFLPGVVALRSRDRSMVLEVSARVLFPLMLVFSIWLLLIGHNSPGGGFAGGVVAGLAFLLRYLAGGRYDLGEAMPIPAGRLLGMGLFVAAAGGAAPLAFGNAVLESTPVHFDLGAIGELHFTTAMILDIGVYILVVGLVIDLVSALGAEIDRHMDAQRQKAATAGKRK